MKKIIKFKDGKETEEFGECHSLKLSSASKYIEPYWFEIIKDVFSYEKERNAGLQEVHKLFTDDRILEGLKLFKEGKVIEGAITDVDVRATVKGTQDYTITLKNWKPEKMLRHRYEMERYIAELFIDCSCQDHVIQHYRSNSSMACKHICAVLWMLQEKYNMPKFFLTPKEVKEKWYDKSKTIEVETDLYGVPMKQFSQFVNVLVLRDFKGIPSSLAYSIHKEPNKGYESKYPGGIKPTWITFDNPEIVEKLIKANIKGYVEMLASRKNSLEDIRTAVRELIPKEIFENKKEADDLLEASYQKGLQQGREEGRKQAILESKDEYENGWLKGRQVGREEVKKEEVKEEFKKVGWFRKLINKIKRYKKW